jgi:flagellar hook-associated protein 2
MANTLFNIWGLASGLDTKSIIDALMTSAKVPVTRYQNEQLEIQWKKEAWDNVKTKLSALQTVISALTNRANIVSKKGTSSNESVLTALTTGDAPLGSYTFNVSSIASSHTVTGNAYTSQSDKISFSQGYITINGTTISIGTQASLIDIAQAINQDANIGKDVYASVVQISSNDYRLVITSKNTGTSNAIQFGTTSNDILITLGIVGKAQSDLQASDTTPISFSTGNITINGKTINVGTSASLQDIVNAINNDPDISSKIKASIESEESNYRLVLLSNTGSIDSVDFSGNNDVFITLGLLNPDNTVKNPNNTGGASTQLPTDLEFTVSGISGTIVRQSNQVSDLFSGITLNVKNTGIAVLTVNYDTSQTVTNIQNFVTVYNDTITYIRTKLTEEREEGITFLTEAEKAKMANFEIEEYNNRLKVGLLRNDSTLREVESQLRSLVSTIVKKDPNTPLSSDIRSLEDIGISLGKPGEVSIEDIVAGRLQIDFDTLNKALTENPETVADLFSKASVFVQDEVPTGDINGANTTFYLKNKPVSYDIRPMVYSDGTLLTQVFGSTTPGPGQFKIDYTTGQLTLGQAPTTSLKVSYGYTTTGETAGIAVRLNNTLSNYTKDITGIIPYTINTLDNQYKELNELINDTNQRLSLYEENLIRQFTALEDAIANLQSQSNFISSYLSGLQKQGGK